MVDGLPHLLDHVQLACLTAMWRKQTPLCMHDSLSAAHQITGLLVSGGAIGKRLPWKAWHDDLLPACMTPTCRPQEMTAKLDPAALEQYRIRGGDAEFEKALASGAAPPPGGRVSVKAAGAGERPEAGSSGRPAGDAAPGRTSGGQRSSGKKRKGAENGGMLYQKGSKRKQGKRRSSGKGGG